MRLSWEHILRFGFHRSDVERHHAQARAVVFKDPKLEAIFADLPDRANPLQIERLKRLMKRQAAKEMSEQLLFGPPEMDEIYVERWKKEHPSEDE